MLGNSHMNMDEFNFPRGSMYPIIKYLGLG